jgi:hypothetical protein
MALLSTSFGPEPERNPSADADAAVNAFDATRMHREAGTAAVASEHTMGPTGSASIGAAFIDGDSLGKATPTAGKVAQAANVPVIKGLPGDANYPPVFTGGNAANQ